MSQIHKESIISIKNLTELISALQFKIYAFKGNLIEHEAGLKLINQIDNSSKEVINEFEKLHQHVMAIEILRESKCEEVNLLREVNNKLVQRVKALEEKPKSNEAKSCNEVKLNQNVINAKNVVNAETQTKIETTVIETPKTLVNAETQTKIETTAIKSPKVISQNPNIGSMPINRIPKNRKIIIYKVAPPMILNDVLECISDQIKEPIDNIKLCKIFINADKTVNYVFQIPACKAIGFIQSLFSYLDSTYKVNYFVNVLRCYKCHSLGHVARFCRHTVCCGTCSSNSHDSKKCSESTRSCKNCISHNVMFNTNFSTCHSTYSKKCSTFHRYILNQRKIIELQDKSIQSNSFLSPVPDTCKQVDLNSSNFDDSGFAE